MFDEPSKMNQKQAFESRYSRLLHHVSYFHPFGVSFTFFYFQYFYISLFSTLYILF